jgi:homoserine kinase
VRQLSIEVPATSANLGPGFDSLGMALDLRDTVHVELDERSDEVVLCTTVADAGPIDPHHNLFCDSYRRWGDEYGVRLPGARFTPESRIPVARGLGSSAACIVAGLAAAACGGGEPHGRDHVLDLASAIEGHPDNAVAAVLGGITVAFAEDGLVHAFRLALGAPLGVALFVPDRQLLTAQARGSLPENVPMRDVIFNLGRTGYLTAAIAKGQWESIGLAMKDRLHQPYRLRHVPELDEIIETACSAGAYGAALSGGGPSVLALTPLDRTERVAAAMEGAGREHGCPGRGMTTGVSAEGYSVKEL